jgi:hypothetical protein
VLHRPLKRKVWSEEEDQQLSSLLEAFLLERGSNITRLERARAAHGVSPCRSPGRRQFAAHAAETMGSGISPSQIERRIACVHAQMRCGAAPDIWQQPCLRWRCVATGPPSP